jgi:chemotaxis protein histidine kinase CheA
MGKQQPIEIFMPPNILKAKVGGSGGLDISAVRRAELAVEELRDEFADWMAEDVNRLAAARDAYIAARNLDTLGALYRASHDLKGQGSTFDYPLVARMAASLCKLTDVEGDGKEIPTNLVDAHVDAIKVIVRQNIKDTANMTATVLAKELERRVAEYQG